MSDPVTPPEGEPGRPDDETVGVERFLGEPTRDLADWRSLWRRDLRFPIRTHRGALGKLVVWVKRLLGPLVKLPLNDLWDRQRVFNLIVLEWLERLEPLERRVAHLEEVQRQGLDEVMRYNDALFSRVDQKLDSYRRETRQQSGYLRSALAVADQQRLERLVQADREEAYVRLENRYRGTEEEIEQRVSSYLPMLEGCGSLLDLGCGRGEALDAFARQGIETRGIDSSEEMVRICREKGLRADTGDIFEVLSQTPAGSLGAIVSFHVIEHLPPESVGRLVALAFRALEPGGRLILETPSPLSLIAGARNFWLDPTHRRPVHPDSLVLSFDTAGFDQVERIDLSPFAEDARLPAIELEELGTEGQLLADRVNRLRDRIDDLLYGYQDFAVTGVKPSTG